MYNLLIKTVLSLSAVLLISPLAVGQSVDWIPLQPGATNGSCTSGTDPAQDILCYGLEYTPGVSGRVTSYTFSFIGDCAGTSPYIQGSSCTMNDNTSLLDACNDFSLFLLTTSGNSGTLNVTSGVPVIMHQVCFDIASGEEVNLTEDAVTGMTVSIDSLGTNEPVDDTPAFVDEMLSPIDFLPECYSQDVCNLNLGTEGRLSFANVTGSDIANGSSLNNSFPAAQSFDLYDEIAEDCSTAGGLNDVTFTFEVLNTSDIYGHGIIDQLGGSTNRIRQNADGLLGNLTFNTTPVDESSTGDTRGYAVKVEFAPHVYIYAHQISVNLSGVNSRSAFYESSYIQFLNELADPYGTVQYNGYFDGGADLSGTCQQSTSVASPWTTSGKGVFVAADMATTDVSVACWPANGDVDGDDDIKTVNAMDDAGLDSLDRVSGFLFFVVGEDVAASPSRDDGMDPDDNQMGNAKTNVNASLESVLEGIDIKGCVFSQQVVLAVDFLDVSARAVDESVQVAWSTAREWNSAGFEVEWSTDGDRFTSLGHVEANNAPSEYSFLHQHPAQGKNVYRIKETDLDGAITYSLYASVFITSKSREATLFPNPVRDAFSISIAGEEKELDFITITDQLGRVVYKQEAVMMEQAILSIETEGWLPGVYTVTYSIEDKINLHKLLKL